MTEAAERLPCPFVGLRPFREEDADFFFGREREIRVIASNVVMSPLTVLYGASGVGKSSLLQAGVMPFLRQSSQASVVYFNTWQNESFLHELTEACWKFVPQADSGAARESQDLDEIIRVAPGRFLLVLDQFEEYLRYQPGQELCDRFERALARLVNKESLPGNILIGIREDALWMLDQRLGLRIPNLLGNTLAVGQLGSEDAKHAIEKPIDRWNELCRSRGARATIDAELVSELLSQVQSRNIRKSESAGMARAKGDREGRVEIAFLQLVLEELWAQAATGPDVHLQLATLTRIGGSRSEVGTANQIVQDYVDDILATRLTDRQRDLCATLFPHLVTPSGSKFAQETQDLVSVSGAPGQEVREALKALLALPNDKGLLKRLSNPEKYEIAHDVLAQPILDWRLRHVQQRERAAEERRLREEAEKTQREQQREREIEARRLREDAARKALEQQLELEKAHAVAHVERQRYEEQRRNAKRLGWMMAILLAVVAAGGIGLYLWYRDHARLLDAQAAASKAIQDEAATRLRAQAAEQEVQAKAAEADGKSDEAAALRRTADQNLQLADGLRKTNNQLLQESTTQLGQLENRATQAEGQNKVLQGQLVAAGESIKKLQDDLRKTQEELKALQQARSTLAPGAETPAPGANAGSGTPGLATPGDAGSSAAFTDVALQDHNGERIAASGRSLQIVDSKSVRVTSDFVQGAARLPYEAKSLRAQLDSRQWIASISGTVGGIQVISCPALLRWVDEKLVVGCAPPADARLELRVPNERAPVAVTQRFTAPGVMDPVSWNGLSAEKRAYVLLCYALMQRQSAWPASTAAQKGTTPGGSLWDHVDAVVKVDEDKMVVRLTDVPPQMPPAGMRAFAPFDSKPPSYIFSSRDQVVRRQTWSAEVTSGLTMQLDLLKQNGGNQWFAQVYLGTGSVVFTPNKTAMPDPKEARLATLHQQMIWRLGVSPGFDIVRKDASAK